ncbi:hypothetical protein O1M63_18370 [Streptomyces mirabilis]|nr:hypothetical protein [Streptomyces mirabilis]
MSDLERIAAHRSELHALAEELAKRLAGAVQGWENLSCRRCYENPVQGSQRRTPPDGEHLRPGPLAV